MRQHVLNATTLTTDCMKQRYKSLIAENVNDLDDEAKAVRSLQIFISDKWPDDANDLTDYGNDEIRHLLNWYKVPLERYNIGFGSLSLLSFEV